MVAFPPSLTTPLEQLRTINDQYAAYFGRTPSPQTLGDNLSPANLGAELTLGANTAALVATLHAMQTFIDTAEPSGILTLARTDMNTFLTAINAFEPFKNNVATALTVYMGAYTQGNLTPLRAAADDADTTLQTARMAADHLAFGSSAVFNVATDSGHASTVSTALITSLGSKVRRGWLAAWAGSETAKPTACQLGASSGLVGWQRLAPA